MPYERYPNQVEMYVSYLVATNAERIRGILLSKTECQNRLDACRVQLQEGEIVPFEVYQEQILASIRLRLGETK